ncbi:MAG: TonB-dependent receptor [Bacteroidaceae bacterium]|nr:TonB-dependent receptor [Bacteroidaceae bacterium]
MKQLYLLLSFLCLCVGVTANPPVDKASLRGTITDAVDGNSVVGASIYFPSLRVGTVTNQEGLYAIENLPAIKTTIQVSYVGHQTIIQEVDLRSVNTLDFVLHENNAMLGEVVVTGLTGSALAEKSPTPVSVVSTRFLQETSSINIIDAIAREPGVSQITTGSGISKPVIRGMGYNRIVVVNDGVRQEGQQWGDEHGIEVDGQSVGSVEILKGPASLMYGSDALAGVLILHDEALLPLGHMHANLGTEYQTNNGLFDYTLNFAGNKNNVVWDVRWSEKMAHAYKNKYDGYVYGSQFRERALSGMLGLNRKWGFSHLKLSAYHLTPGIIEGERDETGAFVKPVFIDGEADEAPATKHDFHSYNHPMPYQQVYHYKAVSENSFVLGDGTLKAVVGYQQNRRQEFEEIETPDEAGLDLRLNTLNYDVHYLSPETNGWKLATGLSGMWQHSENRGEEYLIPDYRLLDIGGFASLTRSFQRLTLSGGLRYDHRRLHSYALMEEGEQRFEDFTRNFSGLTGSLGAIYNFADGLNLRANISRGFRAPNISELGSNGVHEGTFRYEIGNHQLKSEYSWQADLGLDYSSKIFSAQLSLFANHIDNYIFLEKLTDAQGHEVIIDDEAAYQNKGSDARLWGGEVLVDIHPIEQLHFQNTFSYVNAQRLNQEADAKYLPMTPAPRWTSDLRYEIIRDGKTLNNLYVSVGIEYNLRQNHFYGVGGTETATPAYTLLNASAGVDVMHRGQKLFSVFLTGNNLTDAAYQSHLSRLKYAPINERTFRQGVFNMGRNFGLKVVVPLEL